ncbi:hypothetical protein SLS56_006839 [Neofusicoccum ribis]|uniref:Uncharacterized protein n=1 Tax=Neofusicoccum ribis TaxID=45134 RepID=A0ABR3SPM9_9PEZI
MDDSHQSSVRNSEDECMKIGRGLSCECLSALLGCLGKLEATPLDASSNVELASCRVLHIRSAFSTCERLIMCDYKHESLSILIVLAILQKVDDYFYRFSTDNFMSSPDCPNADRWTTYIGASTLIGRKDTMRAIMILAALRSMDQSETGMETCSSRPMATLGEYINHLQGNFEARI